MSSDNEPVAILDAVARRDEKPVSQHVETFHSAVTGRMEQVDDVLWESWNRIFDLAEETPPGKQDRLVEFLLRLKGHQDKDEKGEARVYDTENGKLWGDLPKFGWEARDRWNFGMDHCPSTLYIIHTQLTKDADVREPRMKQEDLTRISNKTAFLARLTALSKEKDPFDFSLYALWALREAFEEECPSGYNAEPAIRNAAVWIEYAGRTLWKLAVENREFRDRLAVPGKKFADKPWRGFTEERWNVWRAGFEDVGQKAEAGEAADTETDTKTS